MSNTDATKTQHRKLTKMSNTDATKTTHMGVNPGFREW